MSKRETLLENIESFDKPIVKLQTPNEDLVTIKGDILRTRFQFSTLKKCREAMILFRHILTEVFERIPTKYIQGSTEIASVLVELFFSEQVMEMNLIDEAEETRKDLSNILEFQEPRNILAKSNFIKENEETILKIQRILCHLLEAKHTPLVQNNFALYKEYNKTFIRLMKSRSVYIDKDFSLTYMNAILTFFSREVSTSEAAFTLYNAIILSEPAALFSILAVLYKSMDHSNTNKIQEKLISRIPENFETELKNTHAEFIRIHETIDSTSQYCFLAVGAAASAVAIGLAVYYRNKRDK